MQNNILVTGGTGFIGTSFIELILKKKNYKIYSLSQKKILKKFQKKKVVYIFCKLQNKKKLKKILSKYRFDYVINFAGHINHHEKKKTYETHYVGLKNLVESLLNQNIKKFIQIGSSVEYGFINSPQKEISKTQLKNLKSIYGKSKLMSTNYLLNLYKKKNFPSIIVRPYLVYGPGQSLDRLIPSTVYNCINNNSFDCSKGNQTRNFIYINDFTKILFKCLLLESNGLILNVGSSKNFKVKYIINKIKRLTKKGFPKFGKIKMRKDEPKILYPDLTLLKKNIIFNEETKIENGLKKTISYYKKYNK